MATYRIGIGSFNLKDGAVGIGTESSGLGNLKVEGTIKTTDLDVGVSTFTRYSGFEAEQTNIIRDQTLSGEYSTTGDIIVDTGNTLTVGLGSTACIGSVECISVKHHFSVPVGDTAGRNKSSGYTEGTVRYNRDLGTMEFFNGSEWRQFTYQSDVQNSPSGRGRGILVGGYDPVASASNQDNISFINIATEGNALDFGNLITGRQTRAASSETRGIIGCGYISPTGTNIIEYITIASAGNGIDFGDGTIQRRNYAALSSSTRGCFGGGESPSQTNVIDYVEIATLGNALDFGDLAATKVGCNGMASPTRGLIHGSELSNKTIEMITIASKGNATFFGEMDDTRRGCGSVSNGIRGLVAGGYNDAQRVSLISSCTMASEGNMSSFGDLTSAHDSGVGMCNSVRAIFTGGYPDHSEPMRSINFASGGDAVHFGFDAMKRGQAAAYCSDSHGGLGGY